MPYKVVGKCVHKKNADGSVGAIVPGGCHKTVEEAQAHKRALYANVKKASEVPMSSSRVSRQKKREKRRLQHELDELRKEDEFEELSAEEEAELLDEEEDAEELETEEVGKSFDGYAQAAEMVISYGPTTFEELDDARATEKKAGLIRQVGWDVEDLVHNIMRSPMYQGAEKADMIKKVGKDFGERVGNIMDTPAEMLKEHQDEIELLEAEALIAQDERGMSLLEKIAKPFQKVTLSTEARKGLSDSDFALPEKRKYPIHDKAHVRNALARAAQQIKAGGEAAADAKKALPKIKAAAKRMGIGSDMEKGKGIWVQKDANGDWRWIGWPSNNFIDRSKDILTEAAHQEYVEWWHKEKPGFPVFTSMHAPGTARTYPVDFVGYENGFLVMSGKLTEEEAAGLLRVQKEYDIGMSHTGWGVRDAQDPRQIVMYRTYEVTDLPLEMADNPFTDLAVMSKEAEMLSKDKQLEYLANLMGSEELAKEALEAKTMKKQSELKDSGIEQKEAQEEPESKQEETQAPDMEAIIKAVGEQFEIPALNEAFAKMQESLDKVPLLEEVIKKQQTTIAELKGDQDEALAEKLTPPASRFAWSKENRPSQADETKVVGEELEGLQKKSAGIPEGDTYWLSQQTGTVPVES